VRARLCVERRTARYLVPPASISLISPARRSVSADAHAKVFAGGPSAPFEQDGGITETNARAALQQLDPLWDELFPAEQARIVALLVERVDIGTDRLNVRLRVDGLSGLAREMLAGDMGQAA